jgi:2-iminoacetate synthase ThiH
MEFNSGKCKLKSMEVKYIGKFTSFLPWKMRNKNQNPEFKEERKQKKKISCSTTN